MGLFDFMKAKDINKGYEQFLAAPGAILIDVRETDEYESGHIPEAKNLPLSRLKTAESVIPDKSVPVFVHCLSGGRSAQARGMLVNMGYQDVRDIGGIGGFRGKIIKG